MSGQEFEFLLSFTIFVKFYNEKIDTFNTFNSFSTIDNSYHRSYGGVFI